AEVLPGQQHAGPLVAGLVEHEVRIQRAHAVVLPRIAFIQVAPLIEQVGTEASALDRLEELLGNDLIGIHVGPIQRRYQPGMCSKGLHAVASSLSISRTSTK